MVKKVAVTGGIGSGKSTVIEIINGLGYKTFSADGIYNELLKNPKFVEYVSFAVGVAPDYSSGIAKLDKQAITKEVFNDKSKLKILNAVTHPNIMKEMVARAEQCDGFVFCEVPLLFEGGFQSLFDNVLVVLRDYDLRVNSVVDRDKSDKASVKQKINSQFDYNSLDCNKYYYITNDGDLQQLQQSVEKAVREIIEVTD